jgi:hypothetical protein
MMLPDSIPTYVQDFLNAFEDMVEYLKGGDQIIAQMEEELRYTHILKLKIGHLYSKFFFSYRQGFGSGSGLDPDSIGPVDPDSESGS